MGTEQQQLQAMARQMRAEWRGMFDWQEDEYCLPPQMVIDYNAAEYGGMLDDLEALETALSAPLHVFDNQPVYRGPMRQAWKLRDEIALRRPFRDGNEETAWWAYEVFLASLGIVVDLEKSKKVRRTHSQ